jgi:hypothetical protein
MDDVDIYPVGLFLDWKQKRFRQGAEYLLYQIKRGKFRPVRQYFNGYLAESSEGSRCGHGWTKRRARKDLIHHLTRELSIEMRERATTSEENH